MLGLSMPQPLQMTGLVLTGGGARGAYQSGVLLALSEMLGATGFPFPVATGSSAGAINVAFLASRASDFPAAARELADLWTHLRPSDVFRTDMPTMAGTVASWLKDLGLGGWLGTGRGRALLDTSPLAQTLSHHFHGHTISHFVATGRLHAVAVTATDMIRGEAVTFFDAAPTATPWKRILREGRRHSLSPNHVLASCAIPLFFPPVFVDGSWFADGSVRLATPLSPAIRLGARRILAIAVRPKGHPDAKVPVGPAPIPPPSLADTAGLLLNAFFLDALEADVERSQRINQTLSYLPTTLVDAKANPFPQGSTLQQVDVLVLRPSEDPASLVMRTLDRFPPFVRHLFRGLGASEQDGWELLSYLGFDGIYTARLLDLGYQDAMARSDELREFFFGFGNGPWMGDNP